MVQICSSMLFGGMLPQVSREAMSILAVLIRFVAMLWGSVHLPFIMSFILAAGSLSKLVVATDCHDAELEDLTEFYQEKSEHEIPIGLRWFYCAGLGIALFCMGMFSPPSFPKVQNIPSHIHANPSHSGLISISHIHKDAEGIRIPKRFRLLNRFAVCIIFLCLPTAHSLNSLHLIATTTGLTIWVLTLELWGMSCWGESFFGEKRACKYTARCKISKKDLESAVKGGHVIKVEELKDRGEKGMYVGT